MLKVTPYLELDESATQLVDLVNGTTIELTFSESALLSLLLVSPNVICGKEELLQAGWPERVVAASSLTHCICTLRKKLEPYPDVQLKTIARRGYQLHVVDQSHVKMLTINDAESIRAAVVDVSPKVKLFGVFLALFLVALLWYLSDYHGVLKQTALWSADKKVMLNIGGRQTNAQMIYGKDIDQLHPSMWQKHIEPEGNHIDGKQALSAFAFTDGHNYSMAFCPDSVGTECSGKGLINITTADPRPAGLNLQDFISLSKKMERRISYNKLLLPYAGNGSVELVEHNYHADIYFPVAGEPLVRANYNMSLIYDDANSGKFYSTACMTDQNCITTSIKYEVQGKFKQYRQQIDKLNVDVFQIKITQKELTKRNDVSGPAMHFYCEIRRHDILDEEVYYYRVHQDEKTAVWIVPYMGNIAVWSTYKEVVF